MGLLNKLCEFIENEKGLKAGFVCKITGEHISTSDTQYKDYCDSSTCWRCPHYPK